jgi:RNA 3'-terminal phosphate cyclase (ATP)
MILVDGSAGEGGGQVLRSALSLSLLTGEPFQIKNIRARRKKAGLLRQHLTAVNACLAISSSKCTGNAPGSTELNFDPGAIRGGEYTFSIGSAGSTSLVLQTIALPLLLADTPSRILLTGGTHNPMSPPFEFIDRSFLAQLRKLGASITVRLTRPGFYPAGGGEMAVEIEPCRNLAQLSLLERGPVRGREARALVAGLPGEIAKRELMAAGMLLQLKEEERRIVQLPDEYGPGNILMIELGFENVVEVACAFGEKGRSAEDVGKAAAKAALTYLATAAPVGTYLADQLLLPCAWAGGGEFVTAAPTEHFRTNLDLIEKFCPLLGSLETLPDGRTHVRMEAAAKRRS